MSRLRGKLDRLRLRMVLPVESPNPEARARMVEHLNQIAEARREGAWTADDAAREREVLRAAQKRRLVGGRLYRT
jgi:hypothetical protein